MNEVQKLLMKGGFVPDATIPNLYTKRYCKAVTWQNGWLTISHYSPNLKRFLHDYTYKTMEEIIIALKPYIRENEEFVLRQQTRKDFRP